jgi:hypothetical protein
VGRFVLGDGRRQGYTLQHPRLAGYLRTEYVLDEATSIRATAAFLQWGQDTVRELANGTRAPDQVQEYLLLYYRKHLEIGSESSKLFFELVSDGWRRAWAAHEGRYRGFAADVRAAFDKIGPAQSASGDITNAMAEWILCGLCLSSIRSVGSDIPGALLAAALETNILLPTQVIDLIELSEPDKRPGIIAEVAGYLPDSYWERAFLKILEVQDRSGRAAYLVAAARSTAESRRTLIIERACKDIANLPEPSNRAWFLVRLAPSLDGVAKQKALADAQEAVKTLDKSAHRVRLLCEIAMVLNSPERSYVLSVARDEADALTPPAAQISAPDYPSYASAAMSR